MSSFASYLDTDWSIELHTVCPELREYSTISILSRGLTAALHAQEARQLALAALLLLVGQQLVDELPDELLGRSIQHRKHVHNQSVHVPAKRTSTHIHDAFMRLFSLSTESFLFFKGLVIDLALIYDQSCVCMRMCKRDEKDDVEVGG